MVMKLDHFQKWNIRTKLFQHEFPESLILNIFSETNRIKEKFLRMFSQKPTSNIRVEDDVLV